MSRRTDWGTRGLARLLPRAIRGQTSITYVDPEDAKRGRPRQYTVFVDEPIELA